MYNEASQGSLYQTKMEEFISLQKVDFRLFNTLYFTDNLVSVSDVVKQLLQHVGGMCLHVHLIPTVTASTHHWGVTCFIPFSIGILQII